MLFLVTTGWTLGERIHGRYHTEVAPKEDFLARLALIAEL